MSGFRGVEGLGEPRERGRRGGEGRGYACDPGGRGPRRPQEGGGWRKVRSGERVA